MREGPYFNWSVARFAHGAIKFLLLYPIMLILLIPYKLFTLCLFLQDRMESWWW